MQRMTRAGRMGRVVRFALVAAIAGVLLVPPANIPAQAQAVASSELVFDPGRNAWVRKPVTGIRKSSVKRRSDASPIPRETVAYDGGFKPGTIVIDTAERRLYRVLGSGKAMRFAIGVGREGFTWSGRERISRKAEWPAWVPPEEMRKRELENGRELPEHMEGGPDNPLGARALYLGNTYYRIHGTNQPWTIGSAVSSGCIRMANDDVIYLYEQAKVGDMVVVQ